MYTTCGNLHLHKMLNLYMLTNKYVLNVDCAISLHYFNASVTKSVLLLLMMVLKTVSRMKTGQEVFLCVHLPPDYRQIFST